MDESSAEAIRRRWSLEGRWRPRGRYGCRAVLDWAPDVATGAPRRATAARIPCYEETRGANATPGIGSS